MVLKDEIFGTIKIVDCGINLEMELIFSQHVNEDYDHSRFPNWVNPIEGKKINWGLIELNEELFIVDTFDTNRTFIRAKKNCTVQSNVHIFSKFNYNLLLEYNAMLIVTNLKSYKQVTLFNTTDYTNFTLDCNPYTHDIYLKKNENILQLDLLLSKKVKNILVNLC